MSGLRGWADARGAGGMVGFGAAYALLALLFVPGAVLTMAAGAVYGVGWGLVVVAVATTVADAAAFLLGRHVARAAVLRLMHRYPRFRVVDRAISRGGWRIVALVRLNPTLPYSASNYLFGVTGVPFLTFWPRAPSSPAGRVGLSYAGFVGVETSRRGAHRRRVGGSPVRPRGHGGRHRLRHRSRPPRARRDERPGARARGAGAIDPGQMPTPAR